MTLKACIGKECGCFASIDEDGSVRSISFCLTHIQEISCKSTNEIADWISKLPETFKKEGGE